MSLIAIVIIGFVLVAALAFSSDSDKNKDRKVEEKRPNAVQISSQPKPYRLKQIMTENELEFFKRLRGAVPDWYIFPQVSMGALIESTARDYKERLWAFRQISQKRVDWAVYDDDMRLVCVVELDDKSHDADKDAARDELLMSAGIPTVRWDSFNKPGEIDISIKLKELRT